MRSADVPCTGPLVGRRIVVTRPAVRADKLCELLVGHGAVPIRMPLVRMAPPTSWEALDSALGELRSFERIVFTSVSGVRAVLDRLEHLGHGAVDLLTARVAAVGPATRAALERAGVEVEIVPEEYRGEQVAAALGSVSHHRILLARAEVATPALPQLLSDSGADVVDVAAYRTVSVEPEAATAQAVRHGGDALTFASPSAVRSFAKGFGADWAEVARGTTVATIGPTTSALALDLGVRVDVEASESTSEGLVSALEAHFARQRQHGAMQD